MSLYLILISHEFKWTIGGLKSELILVWLLNILTMNKIELMMKTGAKNASKAKPRMGLVLSDEAYLAYWEDKNAPMHIQDTHTKDKQLAEDRLIDFISAHERMNRKSMLEGLTAAIGDLTDAELKGLGLKVDAEIAHRELVMSSRYQRDLLKRRLEATYRREDGDMTKEVANV